MKKIFILFLAVALTACAAPATEQPVQPTVAPLEPTATPVVIVETVVVTVIPTQAPTEVPPPTAIPPTAIPPTQPPAPTAEIVNPTASGGPVALDNVLGAGWFVNLTRTADAFSLRCQLSKEITFRVTPTDANITEVNFYYRTQDKATGAVFDWQNAGRMLRDASGNFTLVFLGENVNPNFRKANAWFDYQFIGLSKSGGVVGRSEKIEQQVSYTLDCP
ncbi:MAG TPA: hypothetical protein VN843_34805 [Anaerolineales bacterium]|nr:hypothetical protein [Anaerolineales bacterium]